MDGHTRRPGSPASRAERELLTMAALFTITIIAVLTHSVVSGPVRPSGLQASTLLAVGFSGQEHCSELPFPPPGDLPNPGIKPASPVSPALQAEPLLTEPSGKPQSLS